MSSKLKYLVVDSGAFIQKQPLWNHAEELYSVPEVLEEIRDPQTRQFVESFPVKVNFCQPQPSSLKFVSDFSKKSGDFHVLSVTDLKLLALTYELEVKENGTSHLRLEPLKKITNTTVTIPITVLNNSAVNKDCNNDGETLESIKESGENEKMEEDKQEQVNGESCDEENNNDGWTTVSKKRKPKNFAPPLQENISETASVTSSDRENLECDDEDDEEGWITPDNIDQMTSNGWFPVEGSADQEDEEEEEEAEEDRKINVACITVDYAMQHVLKHIKLGVLGIDGRLIHNLRNFVLRCFTCFTITPDMSLLFCPKCGHKTLKRVSITTNADGTQNIWISRRPLNTRGFRYNLPKPRGGQHAVMPLLTADQRFPHQWAKKAKGVNALDPDFVAGSSPFSARDVNSRAAQHGYYPGNNSGGNAHPTLKYAKIWKPKRKKTVRK